MIKRFIVAGCRDYTDYEKAKEYISEFIKEHLENQTLVFLSGGCRGADLMGERFAKEHGFEICRYNADWKKFGKAAGPIRNLQMVKNCDLVLCFWDGKSRGTASLIALAKKQHKELYIKKI